MLTDSEMNMEPSILIVSIKDMKNLQSGWRGKTYMEHPYYTHQLEAPQRPGGIQRVASEVFRVLQVPIYTCIRYIPV